MAMDSFLALEMSWMEKVLGQGASGSGNNEDFEFKKGDFVRATVNGIPTISFSDRVQQILVRDMMTTLVVKLLGRNLLHTLLQNMIHTLWKPSQQFHLMDVENDYFLYNGLGLISWFAGISLQTSNLGGNRGLGRVVQRIEFESLPFVYFSCGRFGHMKDLCLGIGSTKDTNVGNELTASDSPEKDKVVELTESFGTWMLVDRKSRCNSMALQSLVTRVVENGALNLTRTKMTENGVNGVDCLVDIGPGLKDIGKQNGPTLDYPDLGIEASGNFKNSVSIGLDQPAPRGGGRTDPLGYYRLFNPTFDGLVESVVELNNEVIDLIRHLAVTFKENEVPKHAKPNRVVDSIGRGKGNLVLKWRGSGVKGGTV
ncbi:hypothetical protein Golob_001275 [Gossypium lobatum]|uniref:Zinc knuckle CX2CX4HX4C domain-containing protein n=1 Tax=Gossypium lobatum TaxID=34289 RepID=A0A7J8NAW0_9ROSI|nr:hypothetical protein [Gossypium lobatum]